MNWKTDMRVSALLRNLRRSSNPVLGSRCTGIGAVRSWVVAVQWGMPEPLIIQTLKDKHAEIHGRIAAYEAQIAQARHDLAHINATIRLFTDPEEQRARYMVSHGFFKKGEDPPAALPERDDHPTPAATVPEQAAIDAVLACIRWADMAAEGSTVHLDMAGEPNILRLRSHHLAKFVHQHEGSLVLDVKITRELNCREPLRGIYKQANRAQQVNEGELARGEGRARCHAELMVAGGTFEAATR